MELIEWVNFLSPQDPGFIANIVQQMEIENDKTLKELQEEENEKWRMRKHEWQESKKKLCPKCIKCKLLPSFIRYPLCGYHVDLFCEKCGYIEIF